MWMCVGTCVGVQGMCGVFRWYPGGCERDTCLEHINVIYTHVFNNTSKDRHVLEIGLAIITEPGSLDAAHLEPAAKLVDNETSQRLALDVLRNHDQRLRLHDTLRRERARESESEERKSKRESYTHTHQPINII